MYEENHFLLPLREKLKAFQAKEDEELQRMQMILTIADETVQDVVARGNTRNGHFEDLTKAAAVARDVGYSENKVHGHDGNDQNVLFSSHLSEPLPIAKTDFDAALRSAVQDLRSISRDASSGAVSSVQQRVAPLRSALSVALKERDAGNLRSLSQHANLKTQQRLKNLKNAAVLFDNLGRIQREQLEPIEKMLVQCEFILPFHHPFSIVANHIRNEILAHQTGESVEDEFNEMFNHIDKELKEARRKLDPELTEDQRYPSAKDCYVTLQTEKEERGEMHDRCVFLLEDAKEIERQGREFLAPTTQKVREQAVSALAEVTEKAEKVRRNARQAREQLEASLSTRETACQEKIDNSSKQISDLEERARVNRNKQEKAVRRMREEIKALVKLQQEHRGLVEEIGKHHQDRVVSEVTLEGLRLACSARSARLQDAEKACDHAAGISILINKQLEAALAECQAHISRVTSQEFSRSSRLAQRTIGNCADWYRSLGDLLSIRSQRMQQIQKRGDEGGWQVQFLQQHEVTAQDSAIDELEELRRKIEELYIPLSRSVLALDVDCPTLKFVDQADPETRRMRAVFLGARDAGRERLLREGAKEASDVMSMRRSRRDDAAEEKEKREFALQHIFREHAEEREKRRATAIASGSMLSKMLIGEFSKLGAVGPNGELLSKSTRSLVLGASQQMSVSKRKSANNNNNNSNEEPTPLKALLPPLQNYASVNTAAGGTSSTSRGASESSIQNYNNDNNNNNNNNMSNSSSTARNAINNIEKDFFATSKVPPSSNQQQQYRSSSSSSGRSHQLPSSQDIFSMRLPSMTQNGGGIMIIENQQQRQQQRLPSKPGTPNINNIPTGNGGPQPPPRVIRY